MKKLQKDPDELLVRYQNSDVEARLAEWYGDRFVHYRQAFHKAQHYYDHAGAHSDFPVTISMEMTNKCNLSCSMCYQSTAMAKKEPVVGLTMDVVKKILKECKEERLPSIILGSGTEFLFSKDAAAVIRMVADSGIMDVFLRTNGLLLTREMTDLILDSKITRVFISLDAASPETYRRVRGRDALGLIEKNIGYLLEERARRRSFLPIVRVSFVVLEENKREQKNFLEKWRGKVDYVDFQRFQDLTHVKEKGAQIKNEDIQVSLCSYPFYNLSILPDGNVAPCCTYYGKELVVGSIHKQTLGEIWRSKKMERIRKEILMKQFNPVCKRCLFFRDTELQEEIT